ncbi:MAG: HAMP domain-containing histidine kinase [Candidatus Diapherotrites archaeon]|nr:HAMP domain-containing histidine kinase [Candidatus Diapherotrites archaeon]
MMDKIVVISEPISVIFLFIIMLAALAIVIIEQWKQSTDRKIKERTIQLRGLLKEREKEKKELENMHAALLNMMEDLNESYEELRRTDVLKSRFIRDMSHELKTPVAVISGNIQLLRDKRIYTNRKRLEEVLDMLDRNIKRLEGTIDELLNISRLESLDFVFKKVNISKIIKEKVKEYEPIAKAKNLKLVYKVEPLPKIMADAERIGYAIGNIISNAIKFTDKGYVKIEARKKGNEIIFKVKDTGRGIPKKDTDKVFRKFYKVYPEIPGTGIGLSVTKEIVEAHGGRIWFKSKEGKGSTFIFAIPIK